MRVCIRSINQSNRSISVRLLFLFCSRVFISRSYENRFIRIKSFVQTANLTGHFVHMEPFNKFPLCSYELWTARQCIRTTKVKRLSGVGSCHWDFQTNQKSAWANILIFLKDYFKWQLLVFDLSGHHVRPQEGFRWTSASSSQRCPKATVNCVHGGGGQSDWWFRGEWSLYSVRVSKNAHM